MLTIPDVYAVGLPTIAGLIIHKAMFSAYKKCNYYHLNDTAGPAGLLLVGNIAVLLISQVLIIGGYFYLYSFSFIKVSAHLPFFGSMDSDFFGY
jgi:hypothetical protein